ncbi:MAG: aminopeptidase [Deltaproteobacteria bacterium]|nr:aminopeptidase [Deltaproteobacteria bacterium]
MADLAAACLTAVRDCLGLQPGEELLVVSDPTRRVIADALADAARTLGAEVVALEMAERAQNGAEPPRSVAAAMAAADAVLCPTAKSLTHTKARRDAVAAGARVATMPGITEPMLVRTMAVDYRKVVDVTNRVTAVLTAGNLVRLTTPAGTDLTLPIAGIPGHASSGVIVGKGSWGNLPSGEAYLRPEEGRTEGVLVVDGAMAGIGLLAAPLRIRIERGMAVSFEGPDAARLQDMLDRHGPLARSVAELGIGTNDGAILTGEILEDEKVAGTAHVAFGNNASMGGTVTVPVHLDGIVLHPTLLIDDRLVLDNGVLKI